MTQPLAPPKRKNPLKRTRVPVAPPGVRSRASLAMAIAAAEGRLAFQHCGDCGTVQYPPRELCRACLSADLHWRDTDPAGRIIAETTIRATPDTHFRDHLPIRIGTVAMNAGPSVICRLHGETGRGDQVRLSARIDAAGQAILLALPIKELPHMRDDPSLRELSTDPRHRRILITDGRAPEVPALARALLEAGAAHVFIGLAEGWRPFAGRDGLAALEHCSLVPLDVTDADSLRDLAGDIGARVDILINNARHTRPGGVLGRADTITARQELETTVLGLVRLAHSFGQVMRARGEDGVNSAVAWLNILPVGALVPQGDHAMTSAAGAAALALSHGLRAEMRGSGVRVVNLYAGPLDDEWHQELPPPKLAPRALAQAVVRALTDSVEEATAGEVARDLYVRWRENPALAIREANGGTTP
ncbi:MAG: SDR family oxidoreductase [Paracoccus sp. (in: a-proteobacteria)]|nr:SDR family oxidoreductase [Paracoccus sp. (in: a-proteobacteria)]